VYRTHQNVIALNRFVVRALKGTCGVDMENAAVALGINAEFCQKIVGMPDARLEAIVRTVNAPLLSGASIDPAIWERLARELDALDDMQRSCIRINTMIKMQRHD